MLRSELDDIMDQALVDRRLLDHPFYRRWEAGELSREELAAYAGQYRHFEAALPGILKDIISGLDHEEAALLLASNLADEAPHVELFDSFVEAVGGRSDDAAAPATAGLVDAYSQLAGADPVGALAAVAAYEVQASEIAATKGRALRDHYGLTPAQTAFWDVHAEVESDHASWTLDALGSVTDDSVVTGSAARRAADQWWSFLDERSLTT